MSQIHLAKSFWRQKYKYSSKLIQRSSHTFSLLPLPRYVKQPTIPRRSSTELRSLFIDFFQDKAALQHTFIPPSSIVAKKNEGSYFVNAGMNQFKSVFLGGPLPEMNGAPVSAAVNSQRCLRIGGKHNDLDDVGWDGHHHTSFEMLGNWSFGSYGKAETCSMMWQFLTDVVGLPRQQLYMSVFGGCRELDLLSDVESRDAWLQLGIPDTKLVSFGPAHNLWLMGNQGVGGVCTEVHFDWLGQNGRCARCFVNSESPEVVELWNAVFINHELLPTGQLKPLPRAFVDTGMGLERLTAIVQGVTSNYDTDLFVPLIEEISSLMKQNGSTSPTYTGVPCVVWPPASGAEPVEEPSQRLPCSLPFHKVLKDNMDDDRSPEQSTRYTESQLLSDVSHRIVADHLRSLWLATNEGLLPHRQNVGLKLRHLLHRMLFNASYGLSLRVDQITTNLIPILHKSMLATTLPGTPVWPQLEKRLTTIISNEADHFLPHLSDCLDTFRSVTSTLPFGGTVQPDHVREMLSSCSHLSLDLIAAFSRRFGFQMNASIQNAALEVPKSRNHSSLTSREVEQESALHSIQLANTLRSRGVPSTNTNDKYSYHVRSGSNGDQEYVFPPTKAKVCAILDAESGKPLRKAHLGQKIMLCLDRTNFYTEAGGQDCDVGFVSRCLVDENELFSSEVSESQMLMQISNVTHLSDGDYVLHEGSVTGSSGIKVGEHVLLHIDKSRRVALMQHHTATHALHWALERELDPLGDCPLQQASSVKPGELIFRFSSLTPVTPDMLQRVQDSCQSLIDSHRPISTTGMPFAAAQKLGAVYIKELEYPHDVRVVMVEDTQCNNVPGSHISILSSEICCGTHLLNTGHLQSFIFTGCGKANQSIKELTAVVGPQAERIIANGTMLLQQIEKINLMRQEKDWLHAHEMLCEVEEKVKTMSVGYLHRRTIENQLNQIRYPILNRVYENRRVKAAELRQSALESLMKPSGTNESIVLVKLDLYDEYEVVSDISKIELPHPVIFVDGKKGLLVVPKSYEYSAVDIAKRMASALRDSGNALTVKSVKSADQRKNMVSLRSAESNICELTPSVTAVFVKTLKQMSPTVKRHDDLHY